MSDNEELIEEILIVEVLKAKSIEERSLATKTLLDFTSVIVMKYNYVNQQV